VDYDTPQKQSFVSFVLFVVSQFPWFQPPRRTG